LVFAREVSDPLTSLVKKLDEAAVKNAGASMGTFFVFCSDEEGLEKKLKDLAKSADLKKLILAIDSNRAGPKGYEVAKDADITVLLYKNKTVKVNHVYKKGEFKDADVAKIIAELSEILPAKK
jgi:hypothetical protein